MKFSTATAFLALFATSVTAQQAFIGSPADGFQVSPGQSFTVRVDRPNFQSSAKEVAIVLGFKNCGSNGCLSPDNGIGTELYSGSFNPQYDNPSGSTPPHQNYNFDRGEIESTPSIPPSPSTSWYSHNDLPTGRSHAMDGKQEYFRDSDLMVAVY
ncbi:hypothetical protein AAF712_006228 [Marasmius tenuissimus]|uniref:Uncharacterized protein n=1 Tax=Marasmius tenuissimus TaxID=585030 RepID=A0ABR2ZYQ0_9AGAR